MLRVVLVCLVLLVGCAREAEQISAKEVAERAAGVMDATRTLHFVIERTGFQAPAMLALQRAEGDVVAPDRVRARLQVSTLGINSELGVISIGAERWATNPLSGRWGVAGPEFSTFNLQALFDPTTGVAGLLRRATWTLAPTTDNAYPLRSTVEGAQLAEMTSGLITSGVVDVELMVNTSSFFVTSARLVERDSNPEDPSTWQINLSQPNAAVEIAPPPLQ